MDGQFLNPFSVDFLRLMDFNVIDQLIQHTRGQLLCSGVMKYAGENGVAAYGVMVYVNMIFSAAFVGYSIGTALIIGYHNGARNYLEFKGPLRRIQKFPNLHKPPELHPAR